MPLVSVGLGYVKEQNMRTDYLIVVGVDGSDGGRRALDWAAQEAGVKTLIRMAQGDAPYHAEARAQCPVPVFPCQRRLRGQAPEGRRPAVRQTLRHPVRDRATWTGSKAGSTASRSRSGSP